MVSNKAPEPPDAPKSIKGLPVRYFQDAAAWEAWLGKHHADEEGLWLRIAKKKAPFTSPSYAEALDIALCWGWIDGQKAACDEVTWLQRFTPRRARSIWSQRNCKRVGELTRAGRMKKPGLAVVERAKADGTWDAAYQSQRAIQIPKDLAHAFDQNPEAKAFFATLSGVNRYAVLFRIVSTRTPQNRAKRIAQYIDMLARHETLYPQRTQH